MNIRVVLGWTITILWIILWTILLYYDRDSALKMTYNEWGDFFAGSFAPLAFLWLVIGYFQQGKELSQNTKALEQQEQALQLQVNELKQSVEQQREIVNLTKQQIERELQKASELQKERIEALQPIIDYINNDGFQNIAGKVEYSFELRNSGYSVTSIELDMDDKNNYNLSPLKLTTWDRNKINRFTLKFSNTGQFPRYIKFSMNYLDGERIQRKQKFQLSVEKCGSNALNFYQVEGISL